MAANGPSSPLSDAEFEALRDALSSSSRGRWFLDEFLRRNQKPETQMVLDAIARLETAMIRDRQTPSIDRIRIDIADMQEAIERTKREIGNIKHESEYGNRFQEASDELDAIVRQTEGATQEILAAAEAIQEIAWQMKEDGGDHGACDEIDGRATEIFMACSFQDLTGQRTQKIVQVLQYLESRINMMIKIWGMEGAKAEDPEIKMDTRPDAHLLNGPQLEGRGTDQDTIDALLNGEFEDDEGVEENSKGAQKGSNGDEFDAISSNDGEIDPWEEVRDQDVAFSEAGDDEKADVFATTAPSGDALKPASDPAAAFDFDAALDDADEGEADVFARPAASAEAEEADTTDKDAADSSEATADSDWEAELVRISAAITDEAEDELTRLSPGERQALFS
ncbi:protein phosphatase CheZ [Rhizobiales bacterium]|uniref:protein phosphatase CheZ n=1 Tax=Hongsoonwoonella zoysiae TaxID=2821844 RepID=UPI001560EF70|nr:protein phosphatase CheZ [Hongsoonwoonella zoysiae]NRG17977.1 protein phosphatase CheZ [Hongsoonwoonella zoysiae]